jgi:hypothetical protein
VSRATRTWGEVGCLGATEVSRLHSPVRFLWRSSLHQRQDSPELVCSRTLQQLVDHHLRGRDDQPSPAHPLQVCVSALPRLYLGGIAHHMDGQVLYGMGMF